MSDLSHAHALTASSPAGPPPGPTTGAGAAAPPHASDGRLRLLIPVGSSRRSPAAVRYAIARQAEGRAVDVCLLHTLEPPGQWDLLREARRAGRLARQRVEAALARIAGPLGEAGIPHAAYLRPGGVVFAILDAAEELDCHQIVVPAPPARWWRRLLSRDVVRTLRERQRTIPVVTVSPAGAAVG